MTAQIHISKKKKSIIFAVVACVIPFLLFFHLLFVFIFTNFFFFAAAALFLLLTFIVVISSIESECARARKLIYFHLIGKTWSRSCTWYETLFTKEIFCFLLFSFSMEFHSQLTIIITMTRPFFRFMSIRFLITIRFNYLIDWTPFLLLHFIFCQAIEFHSYRIILYLFLNNFGQNR